MSLKTAVLFLIFNRPDTTNIVFEEIRRAKPQRLYIAADGPRLNRPDDERLCKEARLICSELDWDCEVFTLFRESNLGCRLGVRSAIDWFFDYEKEGIILEDDCVPSHSFFRYCTELLEYYRNEENIFVISGNNFQKDKGLTKHSYYYSIFPHCWGWATWRRAWNKYDDDMLNWQEMCHRPELQAVFGDNDAINYWSNIFDRVRSKQIDSWAYPWTYSCWSGGGLTVLPSVNLVSNIGFGPNATHTRNPDDRVANMTAHELSFPLKHPDLITPNLIADQYTFNTNYRKQYVKQNNASNTTWLKYIVRKLKKTWRLMGKTLLIRD